MPRTVAGSRAIRRQHLLWPALAAPGMLWLAVLFVGPLYVVLCMAFGSVDPIFRSAVPEWNPLRWNAHQFGFVFSHLVGSDGYFGPAIVRTIVYVGLASIGCLLIAFPVAYYVARHCSGRHKGLILALLIAPFWISYMMRMLAWLNLLEPDGLVNRTLSFGGLFSVHVNWLSGRPSTVILGLIYGYVPYMILPLYAGLDRISPHVLEAARDLGAGRFDTFRRVILPMSTPAMVAGLMLVSLPMVGDYYTNDLLSASPNTSMVGNLINNSVGTPGQTGQAAAFIILVLLLLLIPMLLYVRSTARSEGTRS